MSGGILLPSSACARPLKEYSFVGPYLRPVFSLVHVIPSSLSIDGSKGVLVGSQTSYLTVRHTDIASPWASSRLYKSHGLSVGSRVLLFTHIPLNGRVPCSP
jgi:hypothetical protein